MCKKVFLFQLSFFGFMKEDAKDAKKFLKEKKVPISVKKKLLRG